MRLRNYFRAMMTASVVALSLAGNLMAQQEINPDRFESAQSVQQSGQKNPNAKVNTYKKASKQTAKTQKASHSQMASLKKPTSLDQMAQK